MDEDLKTGVDPVQENIPDHPTNSKKKPPSQHWAIRQRRKSTPTPTGVGSRVSADLMEKAAEFWLSQEETTGDTPSALSVGKHLSLSVAPEWLGSPRFLSILETRRFERKLLQLQARPELTNLIQQLMDLGMMEAYKRLRLTPSEIPNTVLFGDILHKWPKMLQEMTAGKTTVRAGDVFQSIVYEINLIQDPVTREKMRTSILSELEKAGRQLVDPEVIDADSVTLLRGRALDVDYPGDNPSTPPPPVPARPSDPPDDPSLRPNPSLDQLWTDPSLD